MGKNWALRLLFLSVFLTLAKVAPTFAWLIAIACCAYAVLGLLAHTGRLPPSVGRLFGSKVTGETAVAPPAIAVANCADAEGMEHFFSARVIGQKHAASEVARALYRRIHAPRRDKPLGVFCFAGPPGVGKTLFAKVVNERLFGGNRDTFLHVDMAQFSQSFAASNLFGQPRGYAGSEQYGLLTGKLRDTPNCIILLDEFEKAHPDVHKRFLTAWNDGFITEGSDSAQVSTRGAIFILTTNAASEQIGEIVEREGHGSAEATRALRLALKEAGFAPEVLSRIDHIIAFAPLKGIDVARVAALEILELVKENGLEIVHGGIDPQILLNSVVRHEASGGSVRDIVRAIEDELSSGIIDAKRSGAATIALRDHAGRVTVEPATYRAAK